MHVLIIPSCYPRHPNDISGSFFREQTLVLHKHDCKVGVIYPELRALKNWRSIFPGLCGISVEQDEVFTTYCSRGMRWSPRTVILMSKLPVWHGCRLFERYVAENGLPDIAYVHSLLYVGPVAAEIYKKYAAPFVVTEHSTEFAREMIPVKELLIKKKSSSVASMEFAVPGQFASLPNKIICFENSVWEELPTIVNERFFTYALPSKSEGNNFEFVNVALADEEKRQINIIQTFAETSKNYPNVQLTLGGGGPERCKLEELARNLVVAEKVKFTGLLTCAQVSTVITADVSVLSSLYETLGVVVIEALALDKPINATQCSGFESIVRKEDGILIPVDDVNAIADALHQMLENCNYYDPVEIRQACIARNSEASIAMRLKQVI